MNSMMKCGHAANASSNGKPSCAICCGIAYGWDIVVDTPSLENRIAVCSYRCGSKQASSTKLPFFSLKLDKPNDEYYCGCIGWD